MSHDEAVDFLKPAAIWSPQVETWADLGCGEGIFTLALADFLAGGSSVFAVDQKKSLKPTTMSRVNIQFIRADFSSDSYSFPLLDGIIMANSLHYISDQHSMATKLVRLLKPNGKVIVIEYDTNHANRWVPFPLNFEKLGQLLRHNHFVSIEKFNERKSAYNTGTMYAATARLEYP